MAELKPFPDVDPDAVTAAGQKFQQAAALLVTAGSTVHRVSATTSWTSQAARPAWDSALSARRADVADAHEVTEHIGNVLRTTGAELARLKSEYQAATLMMLIYPDPRVGHVKISGGIISPDASPVDPHALAQYMAQVTKANDAVDDAEYALALCARELMSVSAVTFPPLPSKAPGAAVDPSTFAIFPLAPAFGAPSGAVFANGVPVQFPTGRAFEAQILRTLGISGGAKQFFRPDAQGNYALPRTPSGRLFRGTFPDSMRAGLLEIKSGTTKVTMNSPQLRVQRFFANRLGLKWNLVVDEDTPVDQQVTDEVELTGGAVYRRVSGARDVFRNTSSNQLVRLRGGRGPDGKQLEETPLTAEEEHALSVAERLNNDGPSSPSNEPPVAEGPSRPYDTGQEYTEQWSKADISSDGDTPLPGTPTEEEPGGPLVPGTPVEEPVTPVEPPIVIEPEDLIP